MMAKILSDIGDTQASELEFKLAIKLAPDQALLHVMQAECMSTRGDMSEAINEYRRAIGIQPSAEALSGLADCLLQASDTIGAVKAARQASLLIRARAKRMFL